MSAEIINLDERRKALGVPILPDTAHETIQRCVMDAIVAATGGVLYCEGQWWMIGPIGAWVPMHEDRIWSEVQALNGLETLEGGGEGKAGKPIRVNAGMCESVTALARARFHEPDAFEAASPGFVTPAGLWTCTPVDGWCTRPVAPADRVRLYVGTDPDMAGTPATWLGVLHRMWGHEADYAERVAFVHEWLGAVLIGSATKHQVAPILVGDGENGKSVIVDVIAGVIPRGLRCSVTPMDLETNQFASSGLVGKALNCVAEIPGGELLTSAKIKAIIDGSEQAGERKYLDTFSFRPRAGHIFSANSLPRVHDLSHGFWRRWVLLTCTAPKISASERRPGLADEIVSSELAQILGYAMRYTSAMVLDRRGYTDVPSSSEAIHAWRADSDSVQQWLDESCERVGQTSVKVLYDSYKRFAETSGLKTVALRTFGVRLSALGVDSDRTESGRSRGITLRVGA